MAEIYGRLQCLMIDGKKHAQPVKTDIRTYENIGKIVNGIDYYTTGCLLDYSYFKENYKEVGIDLSKQQVLDTDPKAIQYMKQHSKLIR